MAGINQHKRLSAHHIKSSRSGTQNDGLLKLLIIQCATKKHLGKCDGACNIASLICRFERAYGLIKSKRCFYALNKRISNTVWHMDVMPTNYRIRTGITRLTLLKDAWRIACLIRTNKCWCNSLLSTLIKKDILNRGGCRSARSQHTGASRFDNRCFF